LEKLAEEGRSAGDAWPDGDWKVVPVYVGLELSADEDDSAWLARQRPWKHGFRRVRNPSLPGWRWARHLTDYAWKARGGGGADTVSDNAAQLFEARLRQAAAGLQDAKALKANARFIGLRS